MKAIRAHLAAARKALTFASALVAYGLANGLLTPADAHTATVYIGAVGLILVYAIPNTPVPPVKKAPTAPAAARVDAVVPPAAP